MLSGRFGEVSTSVIANIHGLHSCRLTITLSDWDTTKHVKAFHSSYLNFDSCYPCSFVQQVLACLLLTTIEFVFSLGILWSNDVPNDWFVLLVQPKCRWNSVAGKPFRILLGSVWQQTWPAPTKDQSSVDVPISQDGSLDLTNLHKRYQDEVPLPAEASDLRVYLSLKARNAMSFCDLLIRSAMWPRERTANFFAQLVF